MLLIIIILNNDVKLCTREKKWSINIERCMGWGFPGEKGIVAVLKLFLWNVMFRWDITECAQCSQNHQLLKYWFEKGSGQLYHTVKRNTKWKMIQFDFKVIVKCFLYLGCQSSTIKSVSLLTIIMTIYKCIDKYWSYYPFQFYKVVNLQLPVKKEVYPT